MASSIRAFVAVKVVATRPLRQVLAQIEPMQPAVRAVDPEHLHVTLKFLGETRPELIPEISRQVQAAAGSESAFDADLVGLGVFPHLARPRVVWAGMQHAEGLARLAERLETSLETVGFSRDSKRFQPHVTLARVKRRPPADLAELIEQHPDTTFGVSPVESIDLFQSELTPNGPRYTLLASAELAAG